ncbi:hypothetical protein WH47_05364, partial [Habropoda laboriosa]
KKKLREFGWKILSHPSYSPHQITICFVALQDFLADNEFDNIDSRGNNVDEYSNDKLKKFYRDGIMIFTERWKVVV